MKKINPLVSVIMNCYNGERYLQEAIDSVYAQTYKNWEIIFWDNSSTDKSAKIAKTYDDKLKYFKSNETTILGKARVEASKMANGDYLAFLDVDDLWLEKKLEKQVNIFEESQAGVGIVYGRTEVIYEVPSKYDFIKGGDNLLPEGNIFPELVKANFIVFSSAMVDKKKFNLQGGFPEHFVSSTDHWIFLHLAKEYKCLALQEVCCKYRVHQSNLSHNQRVIAAEESIDILKSMSPNKLIINGLKYQYVSLIIEKFRAKKYFDFFSILIRKKVFFMLFARIINKIIKTQ